MQVVTMPRWSDPNPIIIRADRPTVSTVRCTYRGPISKAQCLMESQPGSDRCGMKGHGRVDAASSGCPTPPLCDNRNTCLGGCKFKRSS